MLALHIGTTRFNDTTLAENRNYRKENNISGAIYGLPVERGRGGMPQSIKRHALVFVIEMNLSTKKIAGIGRVVNACWRDKYYRIYDDYAYNRYIFKGKEHLERKEIGDTECLEILEEILFKGKGHMCRGQGITQLNPTRLKENEEKIKKFLNSLFSDPS